MKKPKETVDNYMAKLDHPFKAEVQALREIILGVHPDIWELVKVMDKQESKPMSTDETTNQTYDQIAPSFAERYWNIILERELDNFAQRLPAASRVMDLGCGPGRDIGLLRERGFNLLGLDRSTGMLREAQQRVGGLLACADMRRLPLHDNSLDGIWMCASLLHMPRSDVPLVLAEVGRVLRVSGILYVSVQEGTGETWSDSDGGRRFFTYFQVDELRALVEQAGFSVQETWTNSGDHSNWISLLTVRREP